jgi:hypothetical protein
MSPESSRNARSNAFLDVETCSKGILAPARKHGKSPCFSRCHVSSLVGVDWRVYISLVVDGVFFLD